MLRDSAAKSKPGDQRVRRSGIFHPLLYRSNIVGQAPEFNDSMIEIGNGKGRAGIAVARLPDRAGIQEIARIRLQPQGRKRPAALRLRTNQFQTLVAKREPTLKVGVAEKCAGLRGR